MTRAEKIAHELADEYKLSYRCAINLEATANTLMQKFTSEEAKDIIDDVLVNLETRDEYKKLREDTNASS